MRHKLLIMVILSLLYGCAATLKRPEIDAGLLEQERRLQQNNAFNSAVANQQRLHDLHFRLATAAADICDDDIKPLYGALFANVHAYRKTWHEPARQNKQLTDAATVLRVSPGSPAELAGLKEGDVMRKVANETINEGKNTLSEIDEKLSKVAYGATVTWVVQRGNEEKQLTLTPVKGCRYNWSLEYAAAVNAFWNGSKMGFYTGLLDFVKNDEELAYVMAHEMSHAIMSHIRKKMTNLTVGVGLASAATASLASGPAALAIYGAALISSRLFSEGMEAEADYVAIYILARAGFSVKDAPNFHFRLAQHQNRTGLSLWFPTHPASEQRAVAIRTALVEIEQKRAEGKALLPW